MMRGRTPAAQERGPFERRVPCEVVVAGRALALRRGGSLARSHRKWALSSTMTACPTPNDATPNDATPNDVPGPKRDVLVGSPWSE
jgi:hypothetical protein